MLYFVFILQFVLIVLGISHLTVGLNVIILFHKFLVNINILNLTSLQAPSNERSLTYGYDALTNSLLILLVPPRSVGKII